MYTHTCTHIVTFQMNYRNVWFRIKPVTAGYETDGIQMSLRVGVTVSLIQSHIKIKQTFMFNIIFDAFN